jgi:cyclophilin family peptidyl-prolyl cis-trans isomerase
MNQRINFGIVIVLSVVLANCARPFAAFSTSGEDHAPVEINFTNNSKNATAYKWDFGDGSASSEVAPKHEYKASGNYLVSLTAMDGKKKKVLKTNLIIKAPERCLVEIETDYGTMLVQLYDGTPKHRDNFLKLADQQYFDGLLFHRVITGFMVQGGDPQSKNAQAGQVLGNGGPDYMVDAEFVDTLIHVKGALAAARTSDAINPAKRSSGSQFYIVQGRSVNAATLDQVEGRKGFRYSTAQRDAYFKLGGTPFLDRDYTVFGKVIKGLEVLDKIAVVETGPGDRPKTDVRMKVHVIK